MRETVLRRDLVLRRALVMGGAGERTSPAKRCLDRAAATSLRSSLFSSSRRSKRSPPLPRRTSRLEACCSSNLAALRSEVVTQKRVPGPSWRCTCKRTAAANESASSSSTPPRKEAAAAAQPGGILQLTVADDNTEAIGLYRLAGFTPTEKEDDEETNGYTIFQ